MSTKPLDLAQFEGHTLGPWKIQWGRGEGDYPLCIHNHFRNVVTKVARPSDPEAIRNAFLLAAAPELLAELRERRAKDAMVIEALSMTNHFFRNTMGWDSRDAMVERVSVALAAVKGESK